MTQAPHRAASATEADTPALAAIYERYVARDRHHLRWVPPTAEEFAERMSGPWSCIRISWPCSTARSGGTAYTGTFKDRPAYDWAVETSIYVTQGYPGRGIGRALHDRLEVLLRAQGVLEGACSRLHRRAGWQGRRGRSAHGQHFREHLGYRLVGEFCRCGRGRALVQHGLDGEMLGEHRADQPAVRPFPEGVTQLER